MVRAIQTCTTQKTSDVDYIITIRDKEKVFHENMLKKCHQSETADQDSPVSLYTFVDNSVICHRDVDVNTTDIVKPEKHPRRHSETKRLISLSLQKYKEQSKQCNENYHLIFFSYISRNQRRSYITLYLLQRFPYELCRIQNHFIIYAKQR